VRIHLVVRGTDSRGRRGVGRLDFRPGKCYDPQVLLAFAVVVVVVAVALILVIVVAMARCAWRYK
jgi:hypothetical protein